MSWTSTSRTFARNWGPASSKPAAARAISSMTRSIRWTLLLGHTLILGGVMGAFGGLLYLRVRDSALASVETGLSAEARTIASSMEVKANGRFDVTLSEAQARFFQAEGS